MFLSDLSPQATYNFFQYFAAACLLLGIGFHLKKTLLWYDFLLLIFSTTILVKPFAELLSLHGAQTIGQSYTGALIGQITGMLIYLKITKKNHVTKTRILDGFFIYSGLGYAILRVGCHFRGCCWGDLCPFSWALYYKNSEVVTPWIHLPLHPVQLYSAAHGLILFFLTRFYVKKFQTRTTMGFYLFALGIGRLITDSFRGDAKFHKQSLWGMEPNLSLAIILATLGLGMLIRTHMTRVQIKVP